MTKHTASRDEGDRTCASCGRLKATERFPRGAQGRRLTVCDACQAARNAPRPCARCGEATAPADFPRRPSGPPSKYCAPCHAAGLPSRACTKCGATKPAAAFFRYATGQRSRTCDDCRRPLRAPLTCRRCGELRPAADFHVYASGSRAASCADCRRPRPRGPKGVVVSPHPCKVCRGPIAFDEPPSHLAARRTCSPACAAESRRRNDRVCSRCKRALPWSAFDRKPGRRTLREACRTCLTEDIDHSRPDLALRPSINQLRLNLQKLAHLQGKAYRLELQDVRELHRGPCTMCGQAVSCVVLADPAGDVTRANCQGVCRLCRALLRLAPMPQIVLHANEVAAYRPLDPDRLGGCVRCQCTRSNPSASSGSDTRRGGA